MQNVNSSNFEDSFIANISVCMNTYTNYSVSDHVKMQPLRKYVCPCIIQRFFQLKKLKISSEEFRCQFLIFLPQTLIVGSQKTMTTLNTRMSFKSHVELILCKYSSELERNYPDMILLFGAVLGIYNVSL